MGLAPLQPPIRLSLGGRDIPGVMNFQVLVVIRLGRRCLAADRALERPLVSV